MIHAEPFLKGFLEKIAIVRKVSPQEVIEELEKGKLGLGHREDLSIQLRGRDLDRMIQGAALTMGGGLLGSALGHGISKFVPYFKYHPSNWVQTAPILALGGLGGVGGRMLEQVVLDPEDRYAYRSPPALRERLEKERFPLLGPTEGFIPELL